MRPEFCFDPERKLPVIASRAPNSAMKGDES